MRRDSSSPQAYREAVDGPQRELLEALRDLVREVAPDIPESIGSGMLDYPGLANLGAQKNYVSLYVAPAVLARHRDAFSGIDCGKSCIRFRRVEQVEPEAVRKLLTDVRAFRREVAAAGPRND